MFAPILNLYRVTVEQMAILEPAVVESTMATCHVAMREAMDRAVALGVPEQAARDFCRGHIRTLTAVTFGFAGFPISNGAKKAIEQTGRGSSAKISGALWQSQVDLRQAHLFSAMNHGLALDFFHLASARPLRQDLTGIVEDAIRAHRYIAESDEAGLPPIDGRFMLTESRPGQHCLRFETSRDSGASSTR